MKKTYNPCDDCQYSHSKINEESVMCGICEFHKYIASEQDGRILELPCKVGDTLYVLDRDNKSREMILDSPDVRCHCAKENNLCMGLCDNKNFGVCAYRMMNDGTDIGKKVFLTKEAAEAALKEMEGQT